jgi:hypothetical protein
MALAWKFEKAISEIHDNFRKCPETKLRTTTKIWRIMLLNYRDSVHLTDQAPEASCTIVGKSIGAGVYELSLKKCKPDEYTKQSMA